MKTAPRIIPLIIALALAMLGQSCENPNSSASSPEDERIFAVRGVVQELMDDPTMVLIDHEEIPGFMPRMIMPFRVLDPEELQGLVPGAVVTLDFHVSDSDSWATNVKSTGRTGAITYEPERDASQTLGVGDLLPDHEFIDEHGTPLRLSEFRGIPVAITFVFSRCPVPEYCPRMMTQFSKVRERLEADADAPDAYRLLTVSFDSEHDTPETMKAWAAAFGYQPNQVWRLLTTPDSAVIKELASQVGLRFGEANGTLQHNLRTLVLDREGIIRSLYTDETWTVDQLVGEIKEAAR